MVIYCFHLQFNRGALTAERGSGIPWVLKVHGPSLKQTLVQGQSQQGHIHESTDIVDTGISLVVIFQLQANNLSRGEAAEQHRLHALSRVDASYQKVSMAAINFKE